MIEREAVNKSYIWTLPTRVFHWLFAVFIGLAFLTGDEDNLINYHAVIGYGVLILLFFRLIWGVFGPKYSHFRDFPISKKSIREFISTLFHSKQKFIGHNPLASLVMISMFVVIFLTIVTGALTLGIQEGKGIFAYLNSSLFHDMELFKEIHEVLSTGVIVLIVAHLGGILFDKLFHGKHETLHSIFSGYKKTDAHEKVTLTLYQKILAMIVFVFFLGFLAWNVIQPKNALVASSYKPIDYEKHNELFVSECASCHTLYPPSLLPKQSWKKIMANLEDHFGDDASLDSEDNTNILTFLLNNAAETSTMEASTKILDSIGEKDIIAVSQTDFWKRRHREIPKKVFRHEKVKSKANCKACHTDIEKGLIEDENIQDIANFM